MYFVGVSLLPPWQK